MSQRPTSASAKRHFFAVVRQPHQVRPPLVFKIKDPGSCNFPPGIIPIYGHAHKYCQTASLDSDREACSSAWSGWGTVGGSPGPGVDRTRGSMRRAVEAGACSPGFTKHRNSGPCLCPRRCRISCHSARAYIAWSVAVSPQPLDLPLFLSRGRSRISSGSIQGK